MTRSLHTRFLNFSVPIWLYTCVCAAILTVGYNFSYIDAARNSLPPHNLTLLLKLGTLLFLLNLFVISIFSFSRLTKLFVAFCLVAAATANYFYYEYGTIIDKDMIENVVETDLVEATGLLNIKLFTFVFFFGILPASLMMIVRTRPEKGVRLFLGWASRVALSLALVLALAFSSYKDISTFFRNHRDVNQLATPLNVVTSIFSTARLKIKEQRAGEFVNLTNLTHRQFTSSTSPMLVVLVIGETARADHFGINGYSRNTTPLLNQRNIINFESVSSCGTATAVSVPCMFSWQNKSNYNEITAKNSSNLLDFIASTGVAVLWRDNNSGCKEVCNRLPTEYPREKYHDSVLCYNNYCSDMVLLQNLACTVHNMPTGDKLVVLHTLGSHGPEYYKRSDKDHKIFNPECSTSNFQSCTQDEIINAYDNSIVATDDFLDKTIAELEKLSTEYQTSMIYISDHGESLGEGGLYLHGMPYLMAPQAQTHVPMILWTSEAFQNNQNIDTACVQAKSTSNISHDNLFASMLGLMNIVDPHYQPELDIFSSCRESQLQLSSETHINPKY